MGSSASSASASSNLQASASTTSDVDSSVPETPRENGFKVVTLKSSTKSDTKSTERNNLTSSKTTDSSASLGADSRDSNRAVNNGKDMSSRTNGTSWFQREKTMVKDSEQPQYTNNEYRVLESYYHKSGHIYKVLYEGGERFYMENDHSQQWLPFPRKWNKEGLLVTEKVIATESDVSRSNQGRQGGFGSGGGGASRGRDFTDLSSIMPKVNDDRSGFIMHPTRGRVETYVAEDKQNVHYFFDRDSGGWVRMPLSWEFHSELVQKLMAPIEDALPHWQDRHDILATLRACRYDPDETISTYLVYCDDSSLDEPKNSSDVRLFKEKEFKIQELQKTVNSLKAELESTHRELEQEKKDRVAAEERVQELQGKMSDLKVTAVAATAHVQALQKDRPKSSKSKTPIKASVDQDIIRNLARCIKSLHKDQIQLSSEVETKFKELYQRMKELTAAFKKLGQVDSGQSKEMEAIKELYRKEALQRKLLYNKLQELRGNIRVFCRCRYDKSTGCSIQFPSDEEVLPSGSKKSFKVDKVFTPKSTQDEVYEDTMPIITSCVDGYNVCIMAYGQTGSGKTYTMQGPADNPGVNVRSLKDLLKICQERENIKYSLTASMVEIYNDTIHDLLSSDVKNLELRAQGNKVVLQGVTDVPVKSLDDIQRIMKSGEKNRATASTKMNSTSSRSHLIFRIAVEGHDRASGATSHGTLTLCDLAGSERVAKSEAQGQRLVEAAAINKSLSALGQVFTALRTAQLHIPYRNSKLTHILQPSLGGDAKVCLFVNISPDSSNLLETVSTLQFGANARQVALGQAKQNITKQPGGGANGRGGGDDDDED